MQKKRLIVIVLFLLFLIPLSFAADKERVITEWLKDAETATYKDKTFRLDLIKDMEEVIIKDHEGNLIGLENGTCEVSGYYEVCYGGARFTGDYALGEPINEGLLNVSAIIADVIITRKFKKVTININEKIETEVILENDKGRATENLLYQEKIPKEFFIFNVNGCLVDNNSITISGDLGKRKTTTCKYTLKGKKGIKYKSVGVLTYFNGLKDITKKSDEITLEVKAHQAQLLHNLSENLTVNTKYPTYFEIQNIDPDSSINILDTTISFPKEIQIKDSSGTLKHSYNNLEWNGNLNSNRTVRSYIDVEPNKPGIFPINVNIRYSLGGLINENSYEIPTNITYNKPEFYLEIDKKNMTEGEKALVTFGIINHEYEFKNLIININSDLFTHDQEIETIEPKYKGRIFSKEITAPAKAANTEFNFTVNVDYETKHGERLDFNDSITLLVLKSADAVEEIIEEQEETVEETNVVKKIIDKIFSKKEKTTDSTKESIQIQDIPLNMVLFILFDIILIIGIIFAVKHILKK